MNDLNKMIMVVLTALACPLCLPLVTQEEEKE